MPHTIVNVTERELDQRAIPGTRQTVSLVWRREDDSLILELASLDHGGISRYPIDNPSEARLAFDHPFYWLDSRDVCED